MFASQHFPQRPHSVNVGMVTIKECVTTCGIEVSEVFTVWFSRVTDPSVNRGVGALFNRPASRNGLFSSPVLAAEECGWVGGVCDHLPVHDCEIVFHFFDVGGVGVFAVVAQVDYAF
ncbi:hypothetical protein HanHA89_Chr10g0394031 [Helianthus annuus]|nr:hypothetical protein HanHA89_Chr10g0394031 [Helianthus annuus]